MFIVAQGAKRVFLGSGVFGYDERNMLKNCQSRQKTLRLREARRLMLTSSMDVSSAGRQVSVSASQFIREYGQLSGNARYETWISCAIGVGCQLT